MKPSSRELIKGRTSDGHTKKSAENLRKAADDWDLADLLGHHCELALHTTLDEAIEKNIGENADIVCAMLAFLEESRNDAD